MLSHSPLGKQFLPNQAGHSPNLLNCLPVILLSASISLPHPLAAHYGSCYQDTPAMVHTYSPRNV